VNDAVSDWVVARGRRPDGLLPMVGVSALAHAVVFATLLAIGAGVAGRVGTEERTVMTISLGGPAGPRTGGMSPLGGRPVQQVMPMPSRPEPQRPPAAAPPAMTVPTREARPAQRPAPDAQRSAAESTRRQPPTSGPEARPGSALIETGARGIGFGLSTGGGGTGGEIDLANFCCPDYLSTMLDKIQRNWNSKQQVGGVATVRFTILRDGSIVEVEVARSSGYAVLDLTAQRAVAMTRLPPLPAAYTNDRLTVHLNFQYQR
jgi:TonB family protein